jgi:Protein of unknown function (DUF1553)/Protein of unknown function (DUF1549)/Planctomycete cytochrome C
MAATPDSEIRTVVGTAATGGACAQTSARTSARADGRTSTWTSARACKRAGGQAGGRARNRAKFSTAQQTDDNLNPHNEMCSNAGNRSNAKMSAFARFWALALGVGRGRGLCATAGATYTLSIPSLAPFGSRNVTAIRFLLFACLMTAAPAFGQTLPEIDFVEKRIRPLLAERCFECHGPKKQELGLRLDSRSAMLKGGESGPAIVVKNPEASLLIQAVKQSGDLKMPKKGKLTAQQIADLVEWIKMGAPWPEASQAVAEDSRLKHWAFQPIQDPRPPQVRNPNAGIHNAIDRFILAKLEEKGVPPSPPADKITLVRRATFDLIGLPPTPEEIDAFVNDNSPGAFAKVLDRLLASPRYGERWGRYWLDLARFADTKGYVFFQDANYPWAYTYRDYVIESLNADLPYNRFLLEQLAADQLPDANRRSLRAIGFLSLGGQFMNNVHDIIDDRIDVVARGLMGLTVTCARCHDHKFDPISQKDYYGLYGVFASCVEPEVPPLFDEPTPTKVYAAFRGELDAREKKLNDYIQAQSDLVVSGARTRVAEYFMAVHAQGEQPVQDDFMLLSDGPDINPTMVKRWRAQLERSRRKHDPVLAPWHALASLPEKDFAAKAKELIGGWVARPDPTKPLNPLVVWSLAAKPVATVNDVAKRYGELLNDADRIWQEARKANPQLAALPDGSIEQLRSVFHAPGAAANVPPGQLDDLELFPDRPSQGKLQELRKAVEQWRISGVGAPPRAHALVDRPEPYEPRVFLRGNPNQPGPGVSRHFPAVLSSVRSEPFRNGSGRLELAQAIVDPKNPLTARALVNRIWLHHFGQGLVRTPADFGLRSEPPLHPELLDHLAGEFIRGGWSIKKLHRSIMLSATYQQSSNAPATESDPENRLLGRANRQRLDFESLRDSLLMVGGRLNPRIGGPSAKDILSAGSTRRTLYGYVDRLQVPGLYRAFDFPSPDATISQRDITTIPQQALYLMNGPFAVECARALIRRPDVAGIPDPTQRIARLFQLCLGRRATPEEITLGREYVGTGAPAAWERFAQALLNTNEFAFVD